MNGGIYQNYGWVFRTDLEKSSEILNNFIWKDIKMEISDFDDQEINYIN